MSRSAAPATVASLALGEAIPWTWPLTLTVYDRTPTLSATEVDVLLALGDDVRRWRDETRRFVPLLRLLQPLVNARAALEAQTKHGRLAADAAVATLLHHCRRTGCSYWGWTLAQWVEVLGTDQVRFVAAHPGWVERSTRSYLIGLAYLLGCFADFDALGGFKRIAVAEKVFGRERVRTALCAIDTVLCGWGYSPGLPGRRLPGLLGELLLRNASPRLADLSLSFLAAQRAAPAITAEDHALLYQLQRGLAALNLLPFPASQGAESPPVQGVTPAWARWVTRWESTSTLPGRRASTCARACSKSDAGSQPPGQISRNPRHGPAISVPRTWPRSRPCRLATTPNEPPALPGGSGILSLLVRARRTWEQHASSSAIARNGSGSRDGLIRRAPWRRRAVSRRSSVPTPV